MAERVYIDAELAKDSICECYITDDEKLMLIRRINRIPAADVVEVVRCGDCKHSLGHKFPYNYEKVLACNDPHGMTIKAVNPMHFCSYGERKDGGQDEV